MDELMSFMMRCIGWMGRVITGCDAEGKCVYHADTEGLQRFNDLIRGNDIWESLLFSFLVFFSLVSSLLDSSFFLVLVSVFVFPRGIGPLFFQM